jgi:hypothetical protein
MALLKSWRAWPPLSFGGSRLLQAPEYPELSSTVIEPPVLGALEAEEEPCAELVGLLVLPDGEEELLHAAAVSTSAAAPPRQAVRTDISRNLTGIHLLVINRTLVCDKYGVERPEICLGYSHPLGAPARSNIRGHAD